MLRRLDPTTWYGRVLGLYIHWNRNHLATLKRQMRFVFRGGTAMLVLFFGFALGVFALEALDVRQLWFGVFYTVSFAVSLLILIHIFATTI